jgi:two-component sensor histidine kinase
MQRQKKDQDIKLLHKQRDAQQSELTKGIVIRNLVIAAGSLLALLLIVVVNRYLLKQRTSDQITRKNASLQHLLTEKEWLLKEVHHRVKNNLHTVICLLESQARYLESDALEAIETSQHRIYAMSLIHQKLYQSDDIKAIDMANYIPELVQSLIDSFGTTNQISFELKIEPISLSISHAIPLALIINEAVTNSIKYAFPNNVNGVITITMYYNNPFIILDIADNGIGLPQIEHDAEPESLGLRLIRGLSEDIDADTSILNDCGTKITISFRSDPLNDPNNILQSSNPSEELYA